MGHFSIRGMPLPPPIGGFDAQNPSTWLPDSFPTAQKATVVQQPLGQVGSVYGYGNPAIANLPRAGEYDQQNNMITINPRYSDPSHYTVAHEAGHAVYLNDLSQRQKDDWGQLHLNLYRQNQNSAASNPLPSAIARYPKDPTHSFAEAFSQYVANPVGLKTESPEIYNYLAGISHFEYSRKPK